MSRDILDLIDNAIAGTTSEDAMRWAPDTHQVTWTSLTLADLMREYENAPAPDDPVWVDVDALWQAGMISERPPVDPMAGALWLRQRRNTGPAARGRAPRRIDARRTR